MMVRTSERDDGLGIVEALVAIVLFGLLAVAMVPAIIIGLRVSGEATTTTSANQVAQARIEQVREVSSDCARTTAVLAANQAVVTEVDARGARYEVSQSATYSDGTAIDLTTSDWCTNTVALSLSVSARSLDTESEDVAEVVTIVAVPGF